MNSVADQGSDFIHSLGDAARKDPVSAALIGVGVLWFFSGSRAFGRVADAGFKAACDHNQNAANRAIETVRSGVRASTDALAEGAATASTRLKERSPAGLDRASELLSDYANSATDYVEELPAFGIAALDTVRSNLSDVFRSQPLVLGAIGVAIGAGIAAAFYP